MSNVLLASLTFLAALGAFAEDVTRYLDGYPVVAQRDTLGYRISRFVARNRAGTA